MAPSDWSGVMHWGTSRAHLVHWALAIRASDESETEGGEGGREREREREAIIAERIGENKKGRD